MVQAVAQRRIHVCEWQRANLRNHRGRSHGWQYERGGSNSTPSHVNENRNEKDFHAKS